MPALLTPHESLSEHVRQLLATDSHGWPPLHSTSTHDAIAQLIDRVEGLERALHAIALEIETGNPPRDGRDETRT